MTLPEFKTGDIVCFGDRSFLSRAIKFFTRSPGESRTKCSHVGVMFDDQNICEALAAVKIHPVEPRLQDGWRQVYRPIGLTEEQMGDIADQCLYYQHKSYGWWKNLAHALDGLCGGAYLFRRLLCMDDYPICSWLVAWVFERCLWANFFWKPPNAVQPDDIHDWCSSHMKDALNDGEVELIYERKG